MSHFDPNQFAVYYFYLCLQGSAHMEPVTLFEDANFGGQPVGIGEGSTRFPTASQFNDRASSIRVAPGYAAVLYEHANENGGYGLLVDLLEDCPDLSVYG